MGLKTLVGKAPPTGRQPSRREVFLKAQAAASSATSPSTSSSSSAFPFSPEAPGAAAACFGPLDPEI